jgi:hypothetical protein
MMALLRNFMTSGFVGSSPIRSSSFGQTAETAIPRLSVAGRPIQGPTEQPEPTNHAVPPPCTMPSHSNQSQASSPPSQSQRAPQESSLVLSHHVFGSADTRMALDPPRPPCAPSLACRLFKSLMYRACSPRTVKSARRGPGLGC